MINIEYLLKILIEQSGSTWIEKNSLKEKMLKWKVPHYSLEWAIKKGIVLERKMDNFYYYSLPYYDNLEKNAAKNVLRILRAYSPWSSYSNETLFKYIKEGEQYYNITLHEQQKAAVIGAVTHGLFVITGGPGTGKTAVLKVLTYVLKRLFFGCIIKFTAPTGKAARRITESTHYSAKTIQKELKISKEKPKPTLFTDHILIVDEISMLDLELANSLFSAIKDGRKLILVGDVDQLPSVGPGAVLRDLLLSEVVPYTMLTKTFRQAEDSNLFANILNVRQENPDFNTGNDFEVYKAMERPEEQVKQLLDLYLKEMNTYDIHNIALLLPYRKAGDLCSNKMNNIIQEKVNPPIGKPYLESTLDDNETPVRYSKGDPVIQLENRDECANGDVGIVLDVNETDKTMTVQYFNTVVTYEQKELKHQLALAYAISISKSQGSEYKSCIIGITSEHKQMLMRNVIYTGITRAKERCVLLQEDIAMMTAIYTDGSYKRITFFSENLVEENEKIKIA